MKWTAANAWPRIRSGGGAAKTISSVRPRKRAIASVAAMGVSLLGAVNVDGQQISSRSPVAPTIASLSPTSGPAGTLVTLYGTNFTSNNTIDFSGAETSFAAGSPVSSESGTSLQVRVSTCPSYAPQCPGFYFPPGVYNVTVNNANGTSNRAMFVVTPP